MEQPNQPIISDKTIAEIKGWKTSKEHTGLNEEILEALQKQLDYHGHKIDDLQGRLYNFNFDEEGSPPIEELGTPEERKKLRKEIDENGRAYALAQIKLLAYKNGVCLSDKDAQKLLLSGAKERLLYRYNDENAISSYKWQREDVSDSDIAANRLLLKKLKEKLNKNKKKWKAALLPYITPMAPAQTVAATAGQRSAPKTPAHRETRTSKKSGDSNSNSDPDPEPEPPRQLYTFKSFAQLVDCSEKTLRNKVSAGLFPQPQKTAFGPRFTQQHLDYAVTPAKPPKTRGRPRIADSIQGGVQ